MPDQTSAQIHKRIGPLILDLLAMIITYLTGADPIIAT
jgi:hypothetical protein